MVNIPVTVLIAFLGVFIGAWLQRRHWLRSTYEEIRVRESKDASDLASEIARVFDKRITAQRNYLLTKFSKTGNENENAYKSAINEYSDSFNDIRFRLFYYLSYKEVLKYESDLHNRLVKNGGEIAPIRNMREYRKRKEAINNELSIISARVFMFCRLLSLKISREEIGSLRRLKDWKNPQNEFISIFFLLRRLLNI